MSSEGFRNYQNQINMRPLIPRAFPLPINPLQLQNHATLNQFYQTYVRLIRQNNILTNQLKLINSEKDVLNQRFEQIKNDHDRKKRHRRTADQIKRSFICPIVECARSYGSDGSLLQHIKLKHQQFYQSEQYETLLLIKHKKKHQFQESGSQS